MKSVWNSFGIPSVALIVAVMIRWLLNPVMSDTLPLVTLFGAVAIAVWSGGYRAAIVVTVLGYIACAYLFMGLQRASDLSTSRNVLGLIAYFLTCSIIVVFGEAMQRAKLRFAEQSERLGIMLRSIGDAVITTDLEGRVTSLNPVAEILTGWSNVQAVGQPLEIVFHIVNETTRQPVENPALRALQEGVIVGLANHTLLISRDGSERAIDDSVSPIRSHQGEIVGSTLIFRDVSVQRDSHRALAESEARKSAILEAALDCIITIDHKGRVVEFNPAAERTFGYRREDVLGQDMSELIIPPAYRDSHRMGMVNYLKTGQESVLNKRLEMTALRSDGTEFPVELAVTHIAGDDYPLFTAYLRDISDRKETEERLRLSEQRYRSLTQAITSIIWTADAEGRFVVPQASWSQYTGQNWEELKGFGWVNAIHPDDRVRVVKLWKAALISRGLYTAEGRIWHAASKSYRHIEARSIPILNPDGSILEWIGKCLDVEDRKRAERGLRESESRYRAIGEAIDFGVWMCDAQGRNTYASDSFLRMVGMTQQQCSVYGWGDVLDPNDAAETIAAWKECVRTGNVWDREHRFKGVDGQWHDVLARGVPVKGEEGEVLGWVGINLDISRLKQAEDQLRESDRRKDEFLATLAHELRNPLAPVRNAVQVLHLKGSHSAEVTWATEIIDRQIRSMARLIDDLMDLSRISRNKLELRKERVELAAILNGAVETSRPLIEQHSHTLDVTLPAEPIVLDGDLTRLTQVFLNLLNNAAKYTEPGGRISLTAKRQGSDVLVSVKDSGIGIASEDLPRLFVMFSQVEDSLARSQGGLGIGLALVKRLVEMHGGFIDAHSEGLGKGSEFEIRLPLSAEHPASAAPPVPHVASANHLKSRVLVVDDNKDAALTVGMLLKQLGHTIRTAHDGELAVQAASEFHPHVILLDIGLPRLNGYEACRRIRQLPHGKSMLMVAVTGWGQEDDKRKSQEAGFDHHMVKPLDPNVLTDLLASLPTGA